MRTPDARPLNESHSRRIVSTFVYVDKLLQTVERLAATSQPSPFAHEQPDLSDAERRLLLALVARARQRMLASLDRLGIPRPRAKNSSRWSADTALQFADISLSELDAATLRGYGVVNEDDALEVTAVANDLRAIIDRGRRLLRPEEGERLHVQLASVPGPAGEILREVERIVTDRGIIELRALIAAAAERATATSFEVGVFGRVSAGKSSLINALIGAAVLPIGATPVTAVPVRIRRGEARLRLRYADGRIASEGVSSLPNYATEERNPQNEKDIAEIDVMIPSVEEGLTLLDTPGVGSLSLSGPALTFAALPRCDLGLVLAAAGTPLGQDELALVTALQHAGIGVQVLLSKSDLLVETERSQTLQYLRNELRHVDRTATIPVHAVSAVAAGEKLLAQWRAEVLAPLIATRQKSSRAALRRRLEALIGALDNTLAGRESRASERSLAGQKASIAAERTIERVTTALEQAGSQAMELASRRVAEAWASGDDALVAARTALSTLPADALAQVRAAADSLSGSDNGSSARGGHLPPVFDPPVLESLAVHDRPSSLDRVLGRARARQQLAEAKSQLKDAYSRYASRLREWGAVRLRESFEQFDATDDVGAGRLSPEAQHLTMLLHNTPDDALAVPVGASTPAPEAQFTVRSRSAQ